MKLSDVVPYDPESPKGREIAADLTRVLDELDESVRRREAIRRAAEAPVFVEVQGSGMTGIDEVEPKRKAFAA